MVPLAYVTSPKHHYRWTLWGKINAEIAYLREILRLNDRTYRLGIQYLTTPWNFHFIDPYTNGCVWVFSCVWNGRHSEQLQNHGRPLNSRFSREGAPPLNRDPSFSNLNSTQTFLLIRTSFFSVLWWCDSYTASATTIRCKAWSCMLTRTLWFAHVVMAEQPGIIQILPGTVLEYLCAIVNLIVLHRIYVP